MLCFDCLNRMRTGVFCILYVRSRINSIPEEGLAIVWNETVGTGNSQADIGNTKRLEHTGKRILLQCNSPSWRVPLKEKPQNISEIPSLPLNGSDGIAEMFGKIAWNDDIKKSCDHDGAFIVPS